LIDILQQGFITSSHKGSQPNLSLLPRDVDPAVAGT
jgi:hypothetical protein